MHTFTRFYICLKDKRIPKHCSRSELSNELDMGTIRWKGKVGDHHTAVSIYFKRGNTERKEETSTQRSEPWAHTGKGWTHGKSQREKKEALKPFRPIQKKPISQVWASVLTCITHRQSNGAISRSHYRRKKKKSRVRTSVFEKICFQCYFS